MNGGLGAYDSDDRPRPLTRCQRGRAGAGFDDSADAQLGKFRADGGERKRRGRVAGDDDVLGIQRMEISDDLADEVGDRGRAFGAIGQSGSVAEVNNIFSRQNLPNRPHDGESAQAGIENNNRRLGAGHDHVIYRISAVFS